MPSPFCDLPESEKPKKPKVIYPNIKPKIPTQLNRIITKMKKMAFGEDYDLFIVGFLRVLERILQKVKKRRCQK